ncbi:MAG: putative integral rane protein [Myxococcales bacterium]|nr:putative integral rane protein [Myxococcales bacterium]
MPRVDVPLARLKFAQTQRRDMWWVAPLVVFTILSSFIGYATWAALQNEHYSWGPYLSPFYSPLLFASVGKSWFGKPPGWFPHWMSPAMLILGIPAGFRLTCYYYRGAYYKAFWADPPSCAVGEPRKSYLGERSFPLVIQNVHRYFLYLAIIFIFILGWDVWEAMWWPDASGTRHFGIGLGTLVLALNVGLIASYTLGCHSLRHLVGGWMDRFSGRPVRKAAYDCVSCLNRRHMLFAWCSLFAVMGADLYVRLCSMGVINDWRII